MSEKKLIRSYVGGEHVEAGRGDTYLNRNPATAEVLSEVQMATAADLERAVGAASGALKSWRRQTGAERGRVLTKVAALLREHVEELACLEVADTGKPIAEARSVDIFSAADCFEYYGGLAASVAGQHVDLGPTAFGYTRREPLGLCAGIGAWNYPLQIAAWKTAPALAMGNVMLYKPSEHTPTTTDRLAELMTAAGLPPGVFNVLHGEGPLGAALASHGQIAKVSLTGSVATGQRVMAAAADTLKAVTMELGGKSPLLVFDDAHLENAVSAAMNGNFYTQGEVCSNATRIYVQRSVAAAFLERLVARTSALVVGDPMCDETQVGSLISADHLERVMSYIESGLKDGARLLTGGEALRTGKLAKGHFVEPTIFADCEGGMRIVQEEIFGPVMSVLIFDTEDEAIEQANATAFGLAAGVFTRDIQRAHRVVAELEAGTCWINNYNMTPIELPFGGNKQSGIGRENGHAAIEHYTQIKSVYVELGDVACDY